ncbi:hypothetical protein UVI_02053440 [Ustilaginoidea virens]|uniref:Nephrocystin 3-like N-terminal domain-containing protein n=1 Tax=Ustilaginoidea virens TaxID=1159556 RepID=A0A1B5L1B6_USTVR|nr:hypothetical protein UVI_02053440 [Ustilaginoidea virens]
MLIAGIINKWKESPNPLSFFFCEGSTKGGNASSYNAVLRGLLFELLKKRPALLSEIRPEYEMKKEKAFEDVNRGELMKDLLKKLLQDSSLQNTVLVVDALDECSTDRRSLTELIADISSSCTAKWIVSSRDWLEIKGSLKKAQGLVTLDLDLEKESIPAAVKVFIDLKVKELAKDKWNNNQELTKKVTEHMYSNADDTFLWVALVCKGLADPVLRPRDLENELRYSPRGLDNLYEAMLQRVQESSKESSKESREIRQRKQTLATACVAFRPLSFAEMGVLIETMEKYSESDAFNHSSECHSSAGSSLTPGGFLITSRYFFISIETSLCHSDNFSKFMQ